MQTLSPFLAIYPPRITGRCATSDAAQHVHSTRWVSCTQCKGCDDLSQPCVSREMDREIWTCAVATPLTRPHPSRLLPVGLPKICGLCRLHYPSNLGGRSEASYSKRMSGITADIHRFGNDRTLDEEGKHIYPCRWWAL